MKHALLPLVLSLLPACASLEGSPLLFQATVVGQGDIRTDGDAFVAVGGLSGAAGVRFKGSSMPAMPVFTLQRGEVWIRSRSRGVDVRQPVTQPLPAWCRELYSQADLDMLAGLGIILTFEQPEPTL